jgi:hypothetical protein
MKMKHLLSFTLFIISICSVTAQDLANCNTQSVTLIDDQNGFSSSAEATVNFESNCGCNTVGNCEIVSFEIPSNYTCQGIVVSLDNTLEWNDDYFDIYYLPDCIYDGNDDNIYSQMSNYIATIDPIQTGGTFEILVCAGEDQPTSSNSVNLNITTSDLCYIEDCTVDNTPPTCTISDITINGDDLTGLGTITFTDYVTDNCGTVNFSDGNDITNGVGLTNVMDYPCGSVTEFEVGFTDDAGNTTVCNYIITIDCGSSSCQNTVMDFDGIDDRVTFSGLSVIGEFTVGSWFKANNTPNGGNEDRVISFGASTRLELGLTDSGNLWFYDQAEGKEEIYPNNVG